MQVAGSASVPGAAAATGGVGIPAPAKGFKIPGLGGVLGKIGGDGGLFSGSQGGGVFNFADGGGADVLAESLQAFGFNGGSATKGAQRSSGASGGYVDNRVYHIDARGSTDPSLTADRVRQAIVASHDDSIISTIKIQAEKLLRTPQ